MILGSVFFPTGCVSLLFFNLSDYGENGISDSGIDWVEELC